MSSNIIDTLDNFIDFSNIYNNDFISIYLINKNIIIETDLNYYPFILFKNHYRFNENLKYNIINLINLIKKNLNDYSDYEIIDNTKCLIIDTICKINPNCLCPIIYKYKLNFNYKYYNQHNIIKKIIDAGKIQEDFNKSIELKLQIQDDFNKSIEKHFKYNKFKLYISLLLFISINSFIFLNFKL